MGERFNLVLVQKDQGSTHLCNNSDANFFLLLKQLSLDLDIRLSARGNLQSMCQNYEVGFFFKKKFTTTIDFF